MKKSFDSMKQLSKVGISAAFLLISFFSFAQDAEITNAERLIEQDKKKQAVDLLQKAVATYPTSAKLCYHLGHAQLLAGDLAGAKISFDKGVGLDPKEPLNYVGQGHLLILEKKGAQAKPLFDKALGFGKKNVATLQAIAEADLADKAYAKDALPLLQRAKDHNSNDPKTFLLLGDYYLTENNGGSTANAYEDAAALNEKSAKPWYKHALLFQRSKNMAVVEEDLKKAIAIDPDFALAHKELGELYYEKKDGPNAAKHYQIYLSLTDSPQPDDRFRYAFFLFMAKDFAKANDEFKPLSQKSDVTTTTLKFYAQSLLKAGNLAESQKIFEQYLSHPQTKVDDDDYNNYADLLQAQGKDSLAVNAREKSLAINKNQNDVIQMLIKYYFENKKFSDCERICRISVKVRKTPNPNDYFNMGRSQYFQQNYVSADSAFAKLVELQPKFVLGYVWAARSKAAQDGDISDPKAKIEWLAKPYYEKVIEVGDADKEKNKREIIDADKYLVGYYLSKQDFPKGKELLEKILELDPENTDAQQALKDINTPQPQQKPKKR